MITLYHIAPLSDMIQIIQMKIKRLPIIRLFGYLIIVVSSRLTTMQNVEWEIPVNDKPKRKFGFIIF